MATTQAVQSGTVVQVIGPVVDIEFPREHVPKVNDALKTSQGDLVFEVQQQLGDGVVRTIAMGSTDGLRRGVEAINTGASIQVLRSTGLSIVKRRAMKNKRIAKNY